MKTILELEELANSAIKAALAQQWTEAETLNLEILEHDPQNIEAANRLARSSQELGKTKEAKKYYEQVLSLDPYNVIAQKNLDKLDQGRPTSSGPVDQEVFLEEPGKTRAVTLAQPQAKRVSQLTTGESLNLTERHGRLSVTTKQGDLVGYIEDELAAHLLNLIHLGNTYSAYLMTTSEKPQVFLRETGQSAQAAKFISFVRVHSPLSLTTVKDGVSSEEKFGAEGQTGEEGDDAWDTDALQEEGTESSDPDDDFASVSLEALREEEDGNDYNGRDEY